MNKAHIEFLKSDYEKVVTAYVSAFCAKHGWAFSYDDWVGGRVGEIIEICDRFINFCDIKTDIDNDFPEEMFAKWWDYTYRLHELGCAKTVNYWSYAKGCPLPYSEEQLKAIEVAKRRRDDAEQALKDCLATMGDNINFMEKDEVCGNCKNGEVQSDGNYCRCIKRGDFHKYLDPACNIYEGGTR